MDSAETESNEIPGAGFNDNGDISGETCGKSEAGNPYSTKGGDDPGESKGADDSKSQTRTPPKRGSLSPWEYLGIPVGSSQAVIRKAFLEKARKLHPDHGGDADEFQRMYQAYETLKSGYSGNDSKQGANEEDSEVLWEWLRWAGRWGKRMLNQHDGEQKEVLRIKIPWKLLEDRSISVKIDYDGWPLRIPLGRTETVGPGGLLVKLLPIAEWKDEEDVIHKCDEPWFRTSEWMYDVPWNCKMFRIGGSGDGAGEWTDSPGIYGRGVKWNRLPSPDSE
jgi:hypothetical protein